jgi:hypothetical protein
MRELFSANRPIPPWRSFTGIVVTGIVTAVCIGLAGHAHADPADDKFINDVTSQGITGDTDMLIEDGHKWCDAPKVPFVVPYSANAVKQDIISQGYSYRDALAIIFAAERAYCPEQIPPKRGN